MVQWYQISTIYLHFVIGPISTIILSTSLLLSHHYGLVIVPISVDFLDPSESHHSKPESLSCLLEYLITIFSDEPSYSLLLNLNYILTETLNIINID